MEVACYVCRKDQECNLVGGDIIYPHRKDLYNKKFWQCPECKEYVSVHCKTNEPMGFIVSKKIKYLRRKIHAKLDPLWRSGKWDRKELYNKISSMYGKKYHTAEIVTGMQAREIINILDNIKKA